MKKIFVTIIFVVWSLANAFGQTITTESTLQYDQSVGGLQVQRVLVEADGLITKYDYKVDLAKQTKVNDVFGVFLPGVIKTKSFSFDVSVIKLGDGDVEDEGFIDLTAAKSFKNFSLMVEVGRGINSQTGPRDYIITRLSHDLVTTEVGLLSSHNYSNFDEFATYKYYWLAVHPKYIFAAVGNEVDRTWAIVGSKDLSDFGNLSFANHDRKTQDFWFRTQFGFGQVNQGFFCLDNYLTAASYLIVPPFFYKHFSPVSTKGDYGLKFDGKKVGSVEKYELAISKKFGKLGQLAVGYQRQVPSTNGVTIEYYKDASLGQFNTSVELRYESIYKRLSGFITASYQF